MAKLHPTHLDEQTIPTYSFIVPHKNSPQWLNRCLNSIPRRADVEIIVVDDNSDSSIIDWNTFRFEDDRRVRLIKTTEGRGAGYVRNVGLAAASGKWLLFPDADDFYCEGFLEELDKYVEQNYDVVYFNFNNYAEDSNLPLYNKVSNYVKECAEGKISVDYVKYKNNTPWDKMMNADFVRKYSIRFEEIPIANDMFFSFQVGYYCRKHIVINKKLYNYITYKKSITNSNWNQEKIHFYLENLQKYSGFVGFVHHKEWEHGFVYLCYEVFRTKNIHTGMRILWYYFNHLKEIYGSRNKYQSIINWTLSQMGGG